MPPILMSFESHLTLEQFQNMPGGANPQQARTLNQYQAGLAQQQANQMPGKGMPAAGGPPNQGSPMMTQGQDTGAIAGYYNAGEMANGLRAAGQQGTQPGGNHALQDYQTQLMLLEQQNKKRLMMARQEQDTLTTVPGGRDGAVPGAIGPNGQPFQGTSPQGARSVNSPNPADQMKRGTPHMNPAGMPSSPLPEGQSRGSPSGMNYNMQGAQMDPNMAAPYFKMNGMDPNLVGGMQNNMRPPSSHPGFTNQLTPQQLQMARQQNANANWQGGQNGQMMPGANPGAPPQNMAGPGTPQQRQMPPPAAPAVAAAATNGRAPGSPQQGAAPPTPQQSKMPNPKKKNETKDSKAKVNPYCMDPLSFFGNVDIDGSGPQRRDPPPILLLVLHPPPTRTKNRPRQRQRHRSRLSTLTVSRMARMALYSPSLTDSLLLSPSVPGLMLLRNLILSKLDSIWIIPQA